MFPTDEFATADKVVLVTGGADLGHGSGHNVRAGRPKGLILGLTRELAAEFYSGFGTAVRTRRCQIPMANRMTVPERIAASVLFLLSSTTVHITGQYLFVDGEHVHLDCALR